MSEYKYPHKFHIGDVVRYHPIIGGRHDGKLYTVQSCGDIASSEDVAWLSGKAGCVAQRALSHAIVRRNERVFEYRGFAIYREETYWTFNYNGSVAGTAERFAHCVEWIDHNTTMLADFLWITALEKMEQMMRSELDKHFEILIRAALEKIDASSENNSCPGGGSFRGTHTLSGKCCDRAGEYNGFASGPLIFACANHCSCHD